MSRWKTYRVVDLVHQGDTTVEAVVTFDPTHPVYEGHFPGQPVTPGVCILGMLRDLMQQALSKPLVMSEARLIKFHNPLLPVADRRVSVSIVYRVVEENYFAIKATVSADAVRFCSLNARYRLEA